MTRIARSVLPGVPHHATQRGNRRERVFFREEDYPLYRDWRSVLFGRLLNSTGFTRRAEAMLDGRLAPGKYSPKPKRTPDGAQTVLCRRVTEIPTSDSSVTR